MSDKCIKVERGKLEREIQSSIKNSVVNPNQIQNATADQLASSILKLNVDCFDELFEWLSLADLRSLRQTCRRLKQVVNYFIKSNYPAVKIGFGRIVIDSFHHFQSLDPIKSKMIRQAMIDTFDNNDQKSDSFKEILPQLERLQIRIFNFSDDLHELILKWCSNLKYLWIYETVDELCSGQWLCHQYPTIEHFTVDDNDLLMFGSNGQFPALKIFLELNPNIRIFSTTMQLLRLNRNYFLGSNINIDRLNVRGDCSSENGMDEVCDILNQLHRQGFHDRLHLFVDYINEQTDMDQITSIRGMEKLYLNSVHIGTEATLTPMPDLRELCITNDANVKNWESVAKSFINIERVYFREAKADVIALFLRYAPKIKEIKVQNLQNGTCFETEFIELSALNKKRKQLSGACKATIYVSENVFLSTKFARARTEFNLVHLKRAEAADWTHEFH